MIHTITPEEVPIILKKNLSNVNFVILDVRTAEEFQEQHLDKAVNIDFHQADFTTRIVSLDRSKTYLVHCHSGGRSTKTAELMNQSGFLDIYNVVGCIWEKEN